MAVSGKSFSKFKPSTSNQVVTVALLFHVMNAKSATVALSCMRYPAGRSARTDSNTPKTRLISNCRIARLRWDSSRCGISGTTLPGQSMVCLGFFITLLRPESKTRRRTNPWPELWNACHWNSRYLSSPTEEILCSRSYPSTKYWMIANDSLCVHPG